MDTYVLKNRIGDFRGLEKKFCYAFKGIKYANAKRFEYAKLINEYQNYDATKAGPSPMQKRVSNEFEHLEIPERAFYHKEFREGIKYQYSEIDGLNLNIYMPKEGNNHPVIVFFPGGGFDSESINDSSFDGEELAKRGCIVVFAHYRVGVFGYFTHEDIFKDNKRDGNFGLDDMAKALAWVKNNIDAFNGDKNNVTVMGQSAGAMSIQYLLCNHESKDLFDKAIMLSGAGLFPKFSLPKPCEETRSYWLEVMKLANCETFEEFQNLDAKKVLQAVDEQKKLRKDNTYNTMPCIDHYLIKEPIHKAIKTALEMPLMIGFTNNDMYTILLANIAKKYAKKHKAYLYYFDIDAKGDDNQAFHSSDLRYVFGTLSSSWRPYDENDYRASNMMMDYIANFAKSSDPNGKDLPKWDIYKNKVLHVEEKEIKMGKTNNMKLLKNTFKGDPK